MKTYPEQEQKVTPETSPLPTGKTQPAIYAALVKGNSCEFQVTFKIESYMREGNKMGLFIQIFIQPLLGATHSLMCWGYSSKQGRLIPAFIGKRNT